MCSLQEPAEECYLARMKLNSQVVSHYQIARNPLLLKEDSHGNHVENSLKLEIRMCLWLEQATDLNSMDMEAKCRYPNVKLLTAMSDDGDRLNDCPLLLSEL